MKSPLIQQQKQKLRIMQIAPFAFPIKKEIGYGGIERVIRDLDSQFVEQGHESFVIAPHDSEIQGKLYPMQVASSLLNSRKENFEKYSKKSLEFILENRPDIVHDHLGVIKSEAFQNADCLPPFLFTLHGSLNKKDKRWLGNLKNNSKKRVFFNSISCSQYNHFNTVIPVDYMIYNAVDVDSFPYFEKGRGFVFSLGLIDPKKGPDIALDVARELGKKIIVAGPYNHKQQTEEFWNKSIKPKIDLFQKVPLEKIDEFIDFFLSSDYRSAYIGNLTETHKKIWFGKADAFYFPIRWQEPFGLVMIESMATGTPVVAYNRGAVPEVIKHGETGFIVEGQDFNSFLSYASRVNEISRAKCREHVGRNFPVQKQAREYIEAYKDIISKSYNF